MNKSRPCQVTFRMSPEERQRLDEQIRKSGKSQQEYLIAAALEKTVVSVPPGELRAILQEMNRVGNNINQIAKGLNKGYYPGSERVEREIKELRELWQSLKCAVLGSR